MRGTVGIILILGLFMTTLDDAEANADAKTFGYIQTLQIVDEEDLPANPEDFLKKHLNSNTNVLTRDYVLKQKNQVRHQPPQLAVPRDDFTSDGDVDDRAAIQTNEIKDQGEEDPDTGKICVDKVMFREETNYTEVMTCDHSYDERCHTSYITSYQPHQEEECDENFRKVCISLSFALKEFSSIYVSLGRFAPYPMRTRLSMKLSMSVSLSMSRTVLRLEMKNAGQCLIQYVRHLRRFMMWWMMLSTAELRMLRCARL